MKKLFFLLVIAFAFFLFPFSSVHAQDEAEVMVASPTPTIEYKLPYPGMLPDSPLYKLKVLRDKIMLYLITDTDKKAQQYLLMANKQLLMSKMLVDKGNLTLAKETALKGENEMTLMTFVFKNASRVPKTEFLNEVKIATLKHQELLKEIIAKVSKNDAEIFSQILEFSQRNVDQLQNLNTDK